MLQIEEMSVWNCIYCKAENDHTNATRCWNCNRKKPSLKTVKRFFNKQKKDAEKLIKQTKQQTIEKMDNIIPKKETDFTHAIDKIIINP